MAHTNVNCTLVKEEMETSIDLIYNLNEIEPEISIKKEIGLIKTEEISEINETDSEFDVYSQFIKVEQENRDFKKESIPFNIYIKHDAEHIVYPVGNISETKCEDIELEYKYEGVKKLNTVFLHNSIDISDKISSTGNGNLRNNKSTSKNSHKYDTGNISKTKCNDIEVEYKSEDNVKKSGTILSHNIDSSGDFGNRNLHNEESNTNDKLHKCDTCGKTVQSLSGLAKHRRLHQPTRGRKLYNCDICGTTYTSSGGLSRHRRLHTGERPFICEHCDKSFVDRGKLRVHVLQHHGMQPFRCDICGKGMISLAVLQVHLRSHTGEKPYQCDSCEKKFVSKCSLRIHINTFHNDKYPHHNLWHGLYL